MSCQLHISIAYPFIIQIAQRTKIIFPQPLPESQRFRAVSQSQQFTSVISTLKHLLCHPTSLICRWNRVNRDTLRHKWNIIPDTFPLGATPERFCCYRTLFIASTLVLPHRRMGEDGRKENHQRRTLRKVKIRFRLPVPLRIFPEWCTAHAGRLLTPQ